MEGLNGHKKMKVKTNSSNKMGMCNNKIKETRLYRNRKMPWAMYSRLTLTRRPRTKIMGKTLTGLRMRKANIVGTMMPILAQARVAITSSRKKMPAVTARNSNKSSPT